MESIPFGAELDSSLRSANSGVACALSRKKLPLVSRGPALLRRMGWRLHHKRRIWASAFRSFRSHIQILIAKEQGLGDLGCAYLYDANGQLQVNTRTTARILYTEKLLSVYPWLDSVDLETFLLGFDAGEQWASGSEDWDTASDNKSGRTLAWLTPEDGKAIRNEVRDELRKRRHHTAVHSANTI